MRDTAVIGAGAAGLTTAHILAEHGQTVTVIEARDRVGGRMHSREVPGVPGALELGAEFVHGTPRELIQAIRGAGLSLEEVKGQRYCLDASGLQPCSFMDDVFGVMAEMGSYSGPDITFARYLESHAAEVTGETRFRAFEFIQGFDAAEPERVSVHWLQLSGEASEADNGDQLYRLREGYAALARALQAQLPPSVDVRLATPVHKIEWKRGSVKVHTSCGTDEFRRAVLTVPAPVLPEIEFNPRVPNTDAAARIASGAVVRVSLVIGESFARLLPQLPGLSMLHSHDEDFPAFWPSAGGRLLTAWAGGQRAARLSKLQQDQIAEAAVGSLSRILNIPVAAVREHIESAHTHNWQEDPFARGAYSWLPVGETASIRELAASVEQSLYFAGEATSTTGRNGLVHGALETGRRAAHEVLGLR